jgi:hypothetical protein
MFQLIDVKTSNSDHRQAGGELLGNPSPSTLEKMF